ncbi:copper resistance protein NlpE [Chitinophaga agrisoli]|uniref:Copper resistance protein NlpE n=1 Tax=Chitinophaga agrisoli TaxID=2607653 RepID=A0A5B2VNC4_9BACT|nr:copper resistance protein NlpE N-terminal domain-containing protein [Chitinophaga agrisoli]KAA2240274.1 copper resistance protein NlpE [Chitinophaga agrisoli]
MKPKLVITASLFVFAVISARCQQIGPTASSVLGTFAASTPCSQGTRPLPGMAANTDCEFIKWELTLYQDEHTKAPTTYQLHATYGLSKPGTTGFIDGGNKIDMQGNWMITRSAPDSNQIIYQLRDSKTNKTISFLKLSDDLLHLLDSNQHLMIGSAAWSYTLNRINDK